MRFQMVAEECGKIVQRRRPAARPVLRRGRRRPTTLVLGGISTNIGVESTARSAWEHGYALVMVEDAMSSHSAEAYRFSIETIMSRLGWVLQAAEILAAL